jgi:hypothetical protein
MTVRNYRLRSIPRLRFAVVPTFAGAALLFLAVGSGAFAHSVKAPAPCFTKTGKAAPGFCIDVRGPGVLDSNAPPDPSGGPILAQFKAPMACKKTGGRFMATAVSKKFKLFIGISGYKGPKFDNGVYGIEYGAPTGPSFVSAFVSGTPGGNYGNSFPEPPEFASLGGWVLFDGKTDNHLQIRTVLFQGASKKVVYVFGVLNCK